MTSDWQTSTFCDGGACIEVAGWRTPSRSSGGACVEVGNGPAVVAIRDSTDRSGPVLTFGGNTWNQFTAALNAAMAN